MNGITKFLIGAGGTALMAWGNHSVVNSGQQFVDGLSSQTESVIGSSPVNFDFTTGGALSRTVTLSGDVSEEEKARITKELSAIGGMGAVIWKDGAGSGDAETAGAGAGDDSSTATPADTTPASAETVTECQGNIDTVLAGKTIEFRSGSAFIAPASSGLLDEVAAALKPCTGTSVEISGHTDASGSAAINTTLSQERAERVRTELIGRGLAEGQLTAKGYGPSQLKNTANPRAAENRRIEFAVASSAAAPAASQGE